LIIVFPDPAHHFSDFSGPVGGRNTAHTGDETFANAPDGLSRPFPGSIRLASTVSEF
jgi:hypothetical protein